MPLVKDYSFEIITEEPYTILIADDNQFICNSVKIILESILSESNKKLNVEICSDGIDVLKILKDNQLKNTKIKCVIIDENMQFMDGSVTIRNVRMMEEIGRLKYTPFISVTCFEDEGSKKKILDEGCNLIVNKPIDKWELKNSLRQLNII